ncbi:GNAT family N-acetyltransferase [Pseudopedobacter sp.]|uniref:GNAT family N-acetyltransferase n=1 Tax=Pseudopedobacter sp. TaxID=1936787 RepID=UPI00334041E4
MNNSVYLRELNLEDAQTLYKWRNDPKIWKFTKFRPLTEITLETETKWLKKVLSNKNEYRFAICLRENERYIGNIQLINLSDEDAELHLFIGETTLWGKGIGKSAVIKALDFAFDELHLNMVKLEVHKENTNAKKIYHSLGFKQDGKKDQSPFFWMNLNARTYQRIRERNPVVVACYV